MHTSTQSSDLLHQSLLRLNLLTTAKTERHYSHRRENAVNIDFEHKEPRERIDYPTPSQANRSFCLSRQLKVLSRSFYISAIQIMASNYWESTQRRFWTFTKQQLATERKKLEESDKNLVNAYPLPDRRLLSIYFSHRMYSRMCHCVPSNLNNRAFQNG